MDRMSLGF